MGQSLHRSNQPVCNILLSSYFNCKCGNSILTINNNNDLLQDCFIIRLQFLASYNRLVSRLN